MEGPSIYLAAEQLAPFTHEKIKNVSGNSKIGIDRLKGEELLSIFSFGKVLIFQFKNFALRTHFLLFGSFEATVNKIKVTGDYPKKAREPRLALNFRNGDIEMYSCSVKYIEHPNASELFDFTTDIMSDQWDAKQALKKIKNEKESEIADVLLDQSIFSGVGNIIKNEVLLLAKLSPLKKIEEIPEAKLKKLISITRKFVFQFYEWRKEFVLRKHYQIYRQSVCKQCGHKVIRQKTGVRKRISFICPNCEK
jgi:endonuclease-8